MISNLKTEKWLGSSIRQLLDLPSCLQVSFSTEEGISNKAHREKFELGQLEIVWCTLKYSATNWFSDKMVIYRIY